GLDVAADGTAEGDAARRFGGVEHVIAGDRVEADAGGRQRGVDAVGRGGDGGTAVTCDTGVGAAGLDLPVGCKHAAVYAHRPVAVNGTAGSDVAAPSLRDALPVSGLDVAADGTAEGDAARRFGGVEHVIAGDRVEADAGGRQRGVDAVGTVGAGGVGIAGVIEGGDAGLEVAADGQQAAGYADKQGP